MRASAKISEIELFGYKTVSNTDDDPIDEPQEHQVDTLLF